MGIECAHRKIVHGYFGLDHQSDGFEIVGSGLSLRPRGFDAAADAAPKVNFVAEAQRYIKIIECCAPYCTASRGRWSVRGGALTSI